MLNYFEDDWKVDNTGIMDIHRFKMPAIEKSLIEMIDKALRVLIV